MKELSIKEKAQAYDKALEGIEDYIKSLKNVNDGIWSARDIENSLSEIFPQLKESEDEMIRKALIRYHKSTIDIDGIKGDEIVSWLEKQSKQKSAVETKLKIEEGKWYVCISQFCNCIEGRAYKATSDSRIMDDFGTEYDMHSDAYKYFRLWTIQDAKEGDVLSYRDGQWIFVYKEKIDNDSFSYHALYSTIHQDLTINDVGFTLLNHAIIPATKEQCDLLFQKMKEAGYEWDAEKKELKKIEQKPVEWSEEDEQMCQNILECLRNGWRKLHADILKCESWLKSLRHQNQWKPTEEQMKQLFDLVCESRPQDHQLLQDIYFGLKGSDQ